MGLSIDYGNLDVYGCKLTSVTLKMEVTNGLLSNLVETKSMEAVLAPISSQVYQLSVWAMLSIN